ncbi:MAG TPA: energy transducer TonB [Edaphobacter sp.]|nr:energy transducer TonB [Edaphobacter sp.]
MMSAYANSVQKPERFDMYVRKFRSICAMHGVEMGSRTELPGFMRKLMEDRHLAMDFWAFIGKLSNREGGELSDDQILGVVVEGVTDSEFSLEDGGQEPAVDDLRAMLAGVDIQAPQQSPVETAPFPRSEAGSPQDNGQSSTRAAESPSTAESPRSSSNSPSPFTRAKANGNVEHAAVSPATPSPQLDEALLRLELTRLVQEYFDNIDKRISKLEPPVEGATSQGTIATAVTRRSLEEPVTEEEMEELRLRRIGRTRLVLESTAPRVQATAAEEAPVEEKLSERDRDVPIHIPLEHYSPPTKLGKAPLLLSLVLLGSAFALYRDPTLVRKGVAILVRQFRTNGPMTTAILNAMRPAHPRQELSANPPQQSQPSAPLSVLEGTSTPPPASPPAPTVSASTPEHTASVSTPEHTGSVRSQTGGNGFSPSSRRAAATDRAPAPIERAPAQAEEGPADGVLSHATRLIQVDPSVMEANLIVSRVPAYPEAAKVSRVAGHVVMQALISKEGTVEHVHVTEGDSRLRTAAEEAVYKWRYRPYVLNGQPVEVATTVTVNFNLNR